ncbi:hydrogenase-1 operon protein HyaF [Alteromonadaceae bacterium 2753L.S.0a.02]|nr:hydrogenase-1 operon protein HyaF [Alteromonadaceae bacterium 2753L.S.0a.02]
MTSDNHNSTSTPIAFGPGSQPTESDGADLDILQLPSEMQTYQAPSLPEPDEINGVEEALALLNSLLSEMHQYKVHQPPIKMNLSDLDDQNRNFIDQVLGEGEVSILFEENLTVKIQEAALAGVWRLKFFHEEQLLGDAIQVSDIPDLVSAATFTGCPEQVAEPSAPFPAGVGNAPPLLAEINEYCRAPQATPHVINLTLLPQSEADLGFLQNALGAGKTHILSRGYGNCRITSTAVRNVWRVQYFNSQDKNILNTLEITTVPESARAAREDIADSTKRLAEILEMYT